MSSSWSVHQPGRGQAPDDLGRAVAVPGGEPQATVRRSRIRLREVRRNIRAGQRVDLGSRTSPRAQNQGAQVFPRSSLVDVISSTDAETLRSGCGIRTW